MKSINRSTTEKNMDHHVSVIVRGRDGCCVQCGSTYQLTAGHLFSRRHRSTRWNLMNVFCQCWNCNFNHTIDRKPYEQWFKNKFGEEKFEEIRILSTQSVHYKDFEMIEILKELKRKSRLYG